MSEGFPNYKLDYLNKEEKRRPGGLRKVERITEMEPDRIQECLDGIRDAFEEELGKHKIEEKNISYNGRHSGERRIKAELPEGEVKVSAVVESSRMKAGGISKNLSILFYNHNPNRSYPYPVEVDNAKISAQYIFEPEEEKYEQLHKDIAERLTQLPEELDLSRGEFFGRIPRGGTGVTKRNPSSDKQEKIR